MKTILIQGAMDSEICYYREQTCFYSVSEIRKNGFSFWTAEQSMTAEQEGRRIVLQLTGMGMTNAAAATLTALYEFQPDAVIGQGTAGAQVESLHRGDIVIGRKAVNIHSVEMPKRGYGEGMAPEQWLGMGTEYIDADTELLAWAKRSLAESVKNGRVVTGILGTGDLYSREKDRILWLNEKFGNVSEDMESFAVYSVCQRCGVPCISIRVISNNELLDEDYEEKTAVGLQEKIWSALSEL